MHDHCEHKKLIHCATCDEVRCEKCGQTWGTCKQTHWPQTYWYPYTTTVTGVPYGTLTTTTFC